MNSSLQLYLILIVPTSVIAFGMLGYDKRQAKNGGRRVPEKTLHTFELVGGWPGSLAGQRYFHHKTRKTSYQVIFWTIAAVHGSFWAWGM